MALIWKRVTPRSRAANRANSQRSTGPRTESGKKRSSRNSRTHSIFAAISPSVLKELGEDPAELDRVRESLRKVFQPQDDFEDMLIEETARIRWRLLRIQRAEIAILALQRKDFERNHRWEVEMRERILETHTAEEKECHSALTFRPDCPQRFLFAAGILREVRDEIKREGFSQEGLDKLSVIYGEGDFTARDHLLKTVYKMLMDEDEKDTKGVIADWLFPALDREIKSFETLHALAVERDNFAESTQDTQLIPCQNDLDRIIRYEAHLERQLERKLQQLVAWRRVKKEEPLHGGQTTPKELGS
jgi:hypothetical protein